MEQKPTAPAEQQQGTPKIPNKNEFMMKSTSLILGSFTAVGLGLSIYAHKNFSEIYSIPLNFRDAGRYLLISALGAGILLISKYFFEEVSSSFRTLRRIVEHLLGPMDLKVAIFLAAFSAIGEEVLFRGAIQPYMGLVFTSILFGLLHVGPGGFVSPWSMWATISGLMLGWMFQETQCIWVPILTHFAVNFVAFNNIRRNPPLLNSNEIEQVKSITDIES